MYVENGSRRHIGAIWDSHGGHCGKCYIYRYDSVLSGSSSSMFRRKFVPPFPVTKNQPIKQQAGHKKEEKGCGCFLLVDFLVYPSTLQMEAVRTSETSKKFYRNTWNHLYYTLKLRYLEILIMKIYLQTVNFI